MPNRPGLLSTIVTVFLIALSILTMVVSTLWREVDGWAAFLDTIAPGILPAVAASFGVIVAVCTLIYNANAAEDQQRRQHTVNTLLQSRLSAEFRLHKERREAYFREYQDVHYKDSFALRYGNVPTPGGAKTVLPHESARSLIELLNFYEFVALGVRKGDLDQQMLRRSVRGIMCNLVDDCRYLIGGLRVRSPLAYENLCWLCDQWRRPDSIDINGRPNERPIPTEAGDMDVWPDPPGG
ncbi:MAG: DUF4760 domain-containing protein [Phyllobacteriaceae bacterium]|jgi:hypothetical protein|nr:DUF4760 domain-containing protein [Phyllobacteriaceae bacterium]